ncbi:MAG: hypothetical protein JXR39_10090 [Marinilabiliaceae bacterium]|nr:hypothetical protein [Marinilabiliaceae bacterium]
MRKSLALFLILMAVTACSTQKNTRFRRAYHNLNARYNALFNGRESLKAGEKKIAEATRNDYALVLPVFEYSDKENASVATSEMERAVSKGTILIAKHSITKKPQKKPTDTDPYYRKFYNQKEFNKWVDEAWMLIGKGRFYQHDFSQAIQTFDLVIRDFSHTPTLYEALLWKAASFAEKGDYASARMALETYDTWGSAPSSLYGHYMAVSADLMLKESRFEAAVPALRLAAQHARGKQKKLRYRYILAQVLALTGQAQQAGDEYRKVLRMRPPYEMAINARIAAASLGGDNPEQNLKDLNRLARDKKNVEFLDRIYYSMALIDLQRDDEASALEHLEMSSRLSRNNDKQKGLSFLMSGDIYFNRPQYRPAFMAYDSAMVYLPEGDELKTALVQKHASLKILVENIEVVEREDSLQALARMPEAARMAVIDKMIAAEQQRLKEEAKRQQNEFLGYDPYLTQGSSMNQSRDAAKWYFYNSSTLTLGKAEFERKWGKRKLEDNWRRANKSVAMRDELPDLEDPFGEPQAATNPTKGDEGAAQPSLETKTFTREGLMRDVPMTAEAIHQSNQRIEGALLNMGKVYNERLNDYPRAVEVDEELLRRFPQGALRLEAYMDLFSGYQNVPDAAGMNSVRERVGREFPESKFYAYLSDPLFFQKRDEALRAQDVAYQVTYADYLNGDFATVIAKAGAIEASGSENSLLPKYRLLKSLSYGREGDVDQFKGTLEVITASHAGSDEAALAQLLLDELAKGRMPVRGPVAPSRLAGALIEDISAQDAVIEESKGYSLYPDAAHSLLIWVNRGVNAKQLLFNVADYNFSYFLVKDYDLIWHTLPDQSRMLEVRGFEKQHEAMEYLYALRQNATVFRGIDDGSPRLLVVAEPNVKYMLSSGDVKGYLPMYLTHYLKVNLTEPELHDYGVVTGYLRPTTQLVDEESKVDSEPVYTSGGDVWQFALIYDEVGVNAMRLQSGVARFNNSRRLSHLKISIVEMPQSRKVLVVTGHAGQTAVQQYQELIAANRLAIQEVQGKKHQMLIITPENFAVLKQNGDVEEYLRFINR